MIIQRLGEIGEIQNDGDVIPTQGNDFPEVRETTVT